MHEYGGILFQTSESKRTDEGSGRKVSPVEKQEAFKEAER